MDIAGLVRGASEGEGLGNQFLSHIREVDAILEVVRFFDDPDITHVHGDVDPVRDIEIINLELMLVDKQQVATRREKLVRDIRAGVKEAKTEDAALIKVEQALSAGKLAAVAPITEEELPVLKHLNLLTLKPILYCFNGKSGGHNLYEYSDGRAEAAYELVKSLDSRYVHVDAATEYDLNDVADEDKQIFRQELGVQKDGLVELINCAYATLGLLTFFTTGADETRAWTIQSGETARDAGAAIHCDFRDKFIRAEVIPWDKLLSVGTWGAARDAALLRTEGKDYIVADGDVMVFLHS